MGETPGSEKFGINMDLGTLFNRSQKNFQAKMKDIFLKYDRPFDNDIELNMTDFTYETPAGRRRWRFETTLLSPEDIVNKEHINGTKDSKKTPRKSTFFKVEQLSDQTSITLMQHKKEKKPYADDHKRFVLTQNSDVSVMSKTIQVVSPLKPTTSQQVNRFIDLNNKTILLKSPERYSVAVCHADDKGLFDYEEEGYSEPGNKTLEDCYPEMIGNLSRLWDFELKTQAANTIVQNYKRQIWFKNKKIFGSSLILTRNNSVNKTYTIRSAPNLEERATVTKICDSLLLPETCLCTPGSGNPFQIHRPGLFSRVHKFDSPSVSVTIGVDSQRSPKMFEGILDYTTQCKDSPFSARQHMVKKSAMSPGYNASASFSSNKDITNKSQMDRYIAQSSYCKDSQDLQQNLPTMKRRNSFSGFAMLQSPKQMAVKPTSCVSDRTKTLSKPITTSSPMFDEKNHASSKEHMNQLPNKTCSLTRRNSFSAFPVAHRANEDFESLFKSVFQTTPQPDLSWRKGPSQVSRNVISLVYSPGSRRAKRPLVDDFSFSMPKIPRSATQALIGSSKRLSHSKDSRDLLRFETSDSLNRNHSVVASSLPTHMLPQSPVSRRSLSPEFNGRSPKRANACTYRKLSYQEDDGTIARN